MRATLTLLPGALKEALFGMSKAKRLKLEAMELERERRRQEEAFQRREIEWLKGHKAMLEHGDSYEASSDVSDSMRRCAQSVRSLVVAGLFFFFCVRRL